MVHVVFCERTIDLLILNNGLLCFALVAIATNFEVNRISLC